MSTIIEPPIQNPIFSFLSKISILIVLDGDGINGVHFASFGPSSPEDTYFGLSYVVSVLEGTKFLSRFRVTKAHRDTDPQPGAHPDIIENFRFSEHDLSVYDEIWLFGVAGPGETNATMDEAELDAISAFMTNGGGVFATGDHEDLGVELNGSIPRVRSMRKWYFSQVPPDGLPLAPSGTGSDRLDTTQPTPGAPAGAEVPFDNQSDDLPQPVFPRIYTQAAGVLTKWQYPHPLLCGASGPIRIFPDHMHEGEVVVPANLTETFTFNGHQYTEYPKTGVFQTTPEIVAWGQALSEVDLMTENHPVGSGESDARMFGMVGAYDGHREGIGRVCVDSSWHHFFDINLTGDPMALPPKNVGFLTPDGKPLLAVIEQYYRNIASWLAPAKTQARLFAAAAWSVANSQPLSMLARSDPRYAFKDVMTVGRMARDILVQRAAPPCSLLISLWPQLVAGPVVPDPWGPVEEGSVVVDPEVVLAAALGTAVITISQERARLTSLEPAEAARAIQETVTRSVVESQRLLALELKRYGEGLVEMAQKTLEGGDSDEAPA